MLAPYEKRQDRNVIVRAGKFYLFDVGVAGAITHRHIPQAKGEQFGRALEHFILMELLAHRAYRDLDYEVSFWRTKSGLEVDPILGQGAVAIEVKGRAASTARTCVRSRRSSKATVPHARSSSATSAPRVHEGIRILPWRDFLEMLWSGAVIS